MFTNVYINVYNYFALKIVEDSIKIYDLHKKPKKYLGILMFIKQTYQNILKKYINSL